MRAVGQLDGPDLVAFAGVEYICTEAHTRIYSRVPNKVMDLVKKVMDHYASLGFGVRTPSGSCVCEPYGET